jgi:Asp-tRNA(Asn)/Glu-tRNA(Gln) amidotransferase B subunit
LQNILKRWRNTAGKKGLLGLFVGEVMKAFSKGKADPKLTNKLMTDKLDA